MVQRSANDSSDFVRDGQARWWERPASSLLDAVLPGLAPLAPRASHRNGSTDRALATLGRLVPRLVLLGAVGLLALAVLLFGFRALYAEKVYPAVAVGDVPVGGLTLDGAVAEVEARAAELETGTVVFSYGGQEWRPTLSELGAVVDVDGSVDAAYALGRDDNTMGRLGFTNALVREDQRVPLRTEVDRAVLGGWFDRVDAELGQRAEDAQLVIEGTAVRIEPERIGTVVDREAAEAAVLGALGRLAPVTMELPTQLEQPNIYASDLEPGRVAVSAALDGPIVAGFEGQAWNIQPADLVGFLTVETVNDADGPRVEMTLDNDRLSVFLRDIFAVLVNRAPVDAEITWSSSAGSVVATVPSTDGAALRSSAFAEAVSASFLSDQAPVEIPVVVTKPAIDANNLAALKIDALLARGDSNFDDGSADRDTNVEVAAGLLNDTIVAPGEEFSFNGAIGEITADKGYVEAGVIQAEAIGRDIGGGVCQVSTTVFRAAVLGGLDIEEWYNHSKRLLGYERDDWSAGFDAAILQRGPNPDAWADFTFWNDTDGYLLIQSSIEYPRLYVDIYGHDDGRQVDVSEARFWVPEETYEDVEIVDADKPPGTMERNQSPKEPLSAVFTRTVTYADGRETDSRDFESPYRGNGHVYVVSPDMAGRSPATSNPFEGIDLGQPPSGNPFDGLDLGG